MEWHKASLWAGPDGFDRDHPARKLVLRGRRLTRSPPLFQCVAWQPAFCWWGPNKAWRGVTPVHACWQPPKPPPPLKTLASTTPLEPSGGPFIKEAHTSLHIGPNFDSYHGRPLLVSDGLNDSICPIKYKGCWYARNGTGLWQRGVECVCVSVVGGGVFFFFFQKKQYNYFLPSWNPNSHNSQPHIIGNTKYSEVGFRN